MAKATAWRAAPVRLVTVWLLLAASLGLASAAHAQALQVHLDASPGPILPGEPLTQIVTVHNAGATSLTNVVVQVRQPDHTRSSATRSAGATCPSGCWAGQPVNWAFPALAPGERRTMLLTSVLDLGSSAPPAGTELALSATAQAVGVSSVATAHTVQTGAGTSPLRLTLISDRETAQPGDVLTYTLRWANTSQTAADPQVNDLILEATLPAGTTLVSADGATIAGNALLWEVGAIPSRSAGLHRFSVTVNSPATAAGLIATAELTDDNQRLASARKVVPLVAPSPLQVVLSQSADSVRPGEPIHQIVTVRNASAVTMSGVNLEVMIPSWTQDIVFGQGSTCPQGCWETRLANWAIGSIPAGQSRSVFLGAAADTGSSAPPRGMGLDLTAMASATAVPSVIARSAVQVGFDQAPLRLSMVADRTSALAGERLTYTLHVSNASLTAADPIGSGVVLEAAIPAGTTLVSSDGGDATTHNTVRWSVGTLPSRGNALHRYTVVVDSPVQLRDLAADAWVRDDNRRLAHAVVRTPLAPASALSLTVDASSGVVRSGETLTQTLTVRNNGPTTSEGVLLQVQIPSWATDIVLGAGGSCPSGCWANRIAQWNLGSIPAGQARIAVMTTSANTGSSAPPTGYGIELNAIVSAIAVSNAVARSTLPVGRLADAPLRLALTPDRQHVRAGEVVTFTARYANASQTAADPQVTGLTLEASIPAGAIVLDTDGGATTTHGTIRWNLGPTPTRALGLRTFRVRVAAPAGRELFSEAWLIDNNRRLAMARSRLVVDSAPGPLQIDLDVTADPVGRNRDFRQTATVRNTGANTIEDVQVQLQLPAETADHVLNAGGTCPSGCWATRLAQWNLGHLPPGQSRTLQVASVPASGTFGLSRGLSAVARGIAVSDVAASDVAMAGFDELPPIQLAVSVDRETVDVGQVVVHDITLVNTTTSSIGSVTIDVAIPDGATVVTGAGAVMAGERLLRWTLPSLPAQSSTQRRFSLLAAEAPAAGALVTHVHARAPGRPAARLARSVPVHARSPLQLELTSTAGPLLPGNSVVQSLRVRNTSTTTMESVLLQVRQPDWTQSPTHSAGANCPNGCGARRYAQWSFGDLAAGEERVVEMSAVIAGGSNAPPVGSILDLDAVVSALAISHSRTSGRVLIGTTTIDPGPLPPLLGDRIFYNGFQP